MNRHAFTRIIMGCPAGNATPDKTSDQPYGICSFTQDPAKQPWHRAL